MSWEDQIARQEHLEYIEGRLLDADFAVKVVDGEQRLKIHFVPSRGFTLDEAATFANSILSEIEIARRHQNGEIE